MNRDRYDSRGFLVRLVFGNKPRVFQLPGEVTPRVWRFANGVAVRDPSLTEALTLANKISSQKRQRQGAI